MSGDQALMIARRSVSLSKVYPVLGVFLSLLGLLISSIPSLSGSLSTAAVTGDATSPRAVELAKDLPLISVPLQAFAAILFATPVLLLFVYDKNNGVLEYFLSLGMSQRDIYRRYLKAALILASALIVFSVTTDTLAGLVQQTSDLMLEVSGLVAVMALSAVSFGVLIMMSFSSLQKQRVGSNQPLGVVFGILLVMPAYVAPLAAPESALSIDLLTSGITVVLSLFMYLVSGRLISREKLLP